MKYYLVFFMILSAMLYSYDCENWNTNYSDVLNKVKGVKCIDENNNPCVMSHFKIDGVLATSIYYFNNDKLEQISRITYDEHSFITLIDIHNIFDCIYIVSKSDNEYRIDIIPSNKLLGVIHKKYIPYLPNFKQ